MKNKLLYLGILPILCGFASCNSLGTFFDTSLSEESEFEFEEDFDTKLPNQSNAVSNRPAPIEEVEVPSNPEVEEEVENPNSGDEVNNDDDDVEQEAPTQELDLSLNKETVELDFGGTRTHSAVSDSLVGDTAACFNASETITASYSLDGTGYKANQVRVEWELPVDDANYFSLSENGASATVTALLPSRLSTLTAKIIKVADGSVLKEARCELRSVMVNTYWIGNSIRDNTIGGCDISGFNSGYTARLYNTSYSQEEDIVFPSKLKIAGETKMLTRIVGLAKADGSAGIGTNYRPKCRYFFVPNTVNMISAKGFCYIQPNNAPIFQDGGCRHLFLDLSAFGTKSATGNTYYDFANAINLTNGSFPFVKYAEDVSENQANEPTMKDITSIVALRNLNCENLEGGKKKLILQKS